MELKDRIIQLRKQAGLTQEQLGEQMDVSRQAVSKWESGQATPDLSYLTRMCELFQVSTDWLLLGRENFGPNEVIFCSGCGAQLTPGASYCHMCGAAQGKEDQSYCLYMNRCAYQTPGFMKALEILFQYSWATPAFPWDGTPIDRRSAGRIVERGPMVLCADLTYEQAVLAASLFTDQAGFVTVYSDEGLVADDDGILTPVAQPTELPKPEKEPLSGGAIFGLVVLGVIVAILLLSFF